MTNRYAGRLPAMAAALLCGFACSPVTEPDAEVATGRPPDGAVLLLTIAPPRPAHAVPNKATPSDHKVGGVYLACTSRGDLASGQHLRWQQSTLATAHPGFFVMVAAVVG